MNIFSCPLYTASALNLKFRQLLVETMGYNHSMDKMFFNK